MSVPSKSMRALSFGRYRSIWYPAIGRPKKFVRTPAHSWRVSCLVDKSALTCILLLIRGSIIDNYWTLLLWAVRNDFYPISYGILSSIRETVMVSSCRPQLRTFTTALSNDDIVSQLLYFIFLAVRRV
jgi:hypothetical protein